MRLRSRGADAVRPRRRDERGAVAVEAALVLPLVMLLVFGMIEFSLLLRDYVSITASTRSGIRLASAEGGAGPCHDNTASPDPTRCTSPTAMPQLTQDAANAVDRALTSVDRGAILYLLVYEANSKGYPCTSSVIVRDTPGVHDTCQGATNVPATTPFTCAGYVNCLTFAWSTSKGEFRYTSGSWDSRAIGACVNAQDSVGLYLRADHAMLTGLFGTKVPVNDRAVAKFEPLSDDSCDATKVSPHP